MSLQNHSRLQRKNMLRLIAIVFLVYQSVLSPLTYAFYEYDTTGANLVQDTTTEDSTALITLPSFPKEEVEGTPDAGPLPEAGEEEDYGIGIDLLGTGSEVVTGASLPSTGGGENLPSAPILSGSDDTVVSGGVGATEEPIPTVPEIVVPTGALAVDTYGRFLLDSVESVEVASDDMSFCSLVARKNIERFTSVLRIQSPLISRGDAMTLIEEGIQDKTLMSYTTTGLQTFFQQPQEATVFDMYIFTPFENDTPLIAEDVQTNPDRQDDYLNQGHRILVFQATNDQRYVLDPLRGEKTHTPQLLSAYLEHNEFTRALRYLRTLGYAKPLETLVVQNASQLAVYAGQGKISAEFDSNGLPIAARFNVPVRFAPDELGPQVLLPAGVYVTTKNGAPFAIGSLGLTEPVLTDFKNENIDITQVKGSVEFGIPGQGLRFDRPVQIELPVEVLDDTVVEVQVKHGDTDDFGVDGITTNPNATCADGISSDESNSVIVKNGKAVFWTCGASTFIVTPSTGSATILAPISGSTTITVRPTISGTGSTSGAIVSLTLSGSSTVIGTGIVAGSNWSIIPTSSLGYGSQTICISGGNCVTFTVAEGPSFIVWTGLSNTALTGQCIFKNGGGNGWNGRGSSIASIASGNDGYVQWTVSNAGIVAAIGLSIYASDPGGNRESKLNYGIQFDEATFAYQAIELGTTKGTAGTYVLGDTFRTERSGNTITYKKNGTTFYTSLISSSGILYGSVVINKSNSNICDVYLRTQTTVDMHVTKTVTGSSVSSGSMVTYTLVYGNNGTNQVTGVVITDFPGSGLSLSTGSVFTIGTIHFV